MVQKVKEKLNGNTHFVLIGLNVLLVALIATISFMGRDLYGEIRTYPNSVIEADMQQVRGVLETKADKENINVIIRELRGQYNRLYKEVCRQNDKIDELNIYLRNQAGNDT